MRLARDIAAILGAVTLCGGLGSYDWRLGVITAGVLMMLAALAGMIQDKANNNAG